MSTTQRDPGPMTLDEMRSLAVFASYVLVALSLASFLIFSLWQRFAWLPRQSTSRIPFARLALFVALAALSLGVTWYYMLSFFLSSYRDHLRTHPSLLQGGDITRLPPLARVMHAFGIESLPEQRLKQRIQTQVRGTTIDVQLVADWLNHASLFREAWETACSTPARFWWTQHIFGLTAGWSVFLGWQSKRYVIAFAPLFMLLGQLVAVSFAMNLFFIAVILSPAVTDNTLEDKPRPGNPVPGMHLAAWFAVASTLISTPLLPYFANTPSFLVVLAVPHVLLFLPTLGIRGNPQNLWTLYRTTYYAIVATQVVATIFVVHQSSIMAWSSVYWATLKAEFEHQTMLSSHLLFPRLFMKQPLRLQLAIIAEPFFAPAATFFNVLEPQASRLLVFCIDTTTYTVKELIKDPLVVISWISSMVAFFQDKSSMLETALFEHPAVTSVGLDGVLCWLSVASWLITADSVWEGLIGDPRAPAPSI